MPDVRRYIQQGAQAARITESELRRLQDEFALGAEEEETTVPGLRAPIKPGATELFPEAPPYRLDYSPEEEAAIEAVTDQRLREIAGFGGLEESSTVEGLKPMIARTVAPLVGMGLGFALAPFTGGASVLTVLGSATGAYLGDQWAQDMEVQTGLRADKNPWRTATEVLLASVPGMSFTRIARPAARAAAQTAFGAGLGGAAVAATEYAETGELPPFAEVGKGAATGGVLGFSLGRLADYSAARAANAAQKKPPTDGSLIHEEDVLPRVDQPNIMKAEAVDDYIQDYFTGKPRQPAKPFGPTPDKDEVDDIVDALLTGKRPLPDIKEAAEARAAKNKPGPLDNEVQGRPPGSQGEPPIRPLGGSAESYKQKAVAEAMADQAFGVPPTPTTVRLMQKSQELLRDSVDEDAYLFGKQFDPTVTPNTAISPEEAVTFFKWHTDRWWRQAVESLRRLGGPYTVAANAMNYVETTQQRLKSQLQRQIHQLAASIPSAESMQRIHRYLDRESHRGVKPQDYLTPDEIVQANNWDKFYKNLKELARVAYGKKAGEDADEFVGLSGTYVHRRLHKDMYDPTSARYQKVKEEMIAERGVPEEQADSILNFEVSTHKADMYLAAGLDLHRKLDLPYDAYNNDLVQDALWYVQRGSRRMLEVMNYGKDHSFILAKIAEAKQLNAEYGAWLETAYKRHIGVEDAIASPRDRKTIGTLKSLGVLATLGLKTTVSQVGQAIGAASRTSLPLVVKAIFNPKVSKEIGEESGALINSMFREFMKETQTELNKPGALQRLTESYFQITGQTAADAWARSVSAFAGYGYADDMVTRLLKNPKDLKANRWFRRLNMDTGAIIQARQGRDAALAGWKADPSDATAAVLNNAKTLYKDHLLESAQALANDVNLRNDVLGTQWVHQSGWGSLALMFQRVGIEWTRKVLNPALDEAKHGNYAPLAVLAGSTLILGEAAGLAREPLSGRNPFTGQPFFGEEISAQEAAERSRSGFVTKAISGTGQGLSDLKYNFLQVQMLGFLQDLYYSAKYGFEDMLLGASLGKAVEVVEAGVNLGRVAGGFLTGEGAPEDAGTRLAKTLLENVPGVGPSVIRPFVSPKLFPTRAQQRETKARRKVF